MIKLKLKTNPVGQVYLPKELREEWGQSLELIPNAQAGVLYPEKMPLKAVLRSLDVIKRDIQNRLESRESKVWARAGREPKPSGRSSKLKPRVSELQLEDGRSSGVS